MLRMVMFLLGVGVVGVQLAEPAEAALSGGQAEQEADPGAE
jgi:hypothetical protein